MPVAGEAIVTAALRYRGRGYVFGGVPGSGVGNWDCSSFVNWVLGHDLGMAIPGFPAGSYRGQVHGPVVTDYATWTGADTTSGPPMPGELCIWDGAGAGGHIGIAVDSSHMISALSPQYGTALTPIEGYGPSGVPFMVRRVNGTAIGGETATSTTSGDGFGGLLGGVFVGAALPVVVMIAALGFFTVVGAAAAFLIAAGMRKAVNRW